MAVGATGYGLSLRCYLLAQRAFGAARSSDWRATLVHSERDRVVPTGSYETEFNDPAHRERDDYTLAEFAADQAADAHTTLHQRVYFGSYRYRGNFPYAAPSYHLNRDGAEGRWWGLEGRLVSRALAGQRWTLGFEYRDNLRQNQKNADLGDRCYDASLTLQPGACLDSRTSSHLASLYAQDEISLGRQTLLTAGLRFDHRSSGGDGFPRQIRHTTYRHAWLPDSEFRDSRENTGHRHRDG